MWMPRPGERDVISALHYPGVHLCLDGPSGAGKTSLARTALEVLSRKHTTLRYIYTRVGGTSTWQSFKRQLVANTSNNIAGTEVKVGIRDFLPYIEFAGTVFGDQEVARIPADEVLEKLDERAIAALLMREDFLLVIDDADQCDPILLKHLTEIAKEMTDSTITGHAKIFFIGSDRIFATLLQVKPPLKDRMHHLSIGVFEENKWGWDFIVKGLHNLGLFNPDKDKYTTKEERAKAIELVWKAADGLPKSIVKLGQEIAERGRGRRRVSVADIKLCCEARLHLHFRACRKKHSEITTLIREDKTVAEVLRWFYNRGIGRVHKYRALSAAMSESISSIALDNVIDKLDKLDILVRTGSEEEVLFVCDPLMVHTLGVAICEPQLVGMPNDYFESTAKQMLLPFADA